MKLFVFKVHENSLYHEGMILVAAESPEEARQHILPLTLEAVWPSKPGHVHENCRCNELFLGEDAVVKLVRTDYVDNLYYCEWYLAKVYDLVNEYTGTEGVKLVSYAHHDG